MKYKMICIDMDGTLLGRNRKISEASKEVLREANKKGIKIVITTGRLYNNAAYFSELIGVDSAVIGGNGAIIMEKNKVKPIYRSRFNKDVCEKLLDLADKHRVVLHFHTINNIVSNSYLSYNIAKIILPDRNYDGLNIYLGVIKSKKAWDKILSEKAGAITKTILFALEPKRIEAYREDLDKIDEVTYFTSGSRSIEINMKGVSKGNAVKRLAEYYGIKREEVICIGDNENDVSMIEYAGLGIAMGNGIQKVKDIADYVTDTNVHDGVRKAVEKFVLNEEEI
ncbi:MAG: Cof-type HAD-IIB family hydrolase [Clostridium sp.]|uniref:Cof-type HAD-IIB family hydrolase n=1 Tax=Clostridium sp. TaxID=1506 RepID=UPI003EE5F41E